MHAHAYTRAHTHRLTSSRINRGKAEKWVFPYSAEEVELEKKEWLKKFNVV